MSTNKFLFSEQAASHINVISIMRRVGVHNIGHTYTARSLWRNRFIALAGNRHHFLRMG